eukprot:6689705-Pyramimonas_sp.AAC.1
MALPLAPHRVIQLQQGRLHVRKWSGLSSKAINRAYTSFQGRENKTKVGLRNVVSAAGSSNRGIAQTGSQSGLQKAYGFSSKVRVSVGRGV